MDAFYTNVLLMMTANPRLPLISLRNMFYKKRNNQLTVRKNMKDICYLLKKKFRCRRARVGLAIRQYHQNADIFHASHQPSSAW